MGEFLPMLKLVFEVCFDLEWEKGWHSEALKVVGNERGVGSLAIV